MCIEYLNKLEGLFKGGKKLISEIISGGDREKVREQPLKVTTQEKEAVSSAQMLNNSTLFFFFFFGKSNFLFSGFLPILHLLVPST